MVESARPKNSAARSLMYRRYTCGPIRSAARFCPDRPCAVTFRHSHISLEMTSRMPRAPARAPSIEPAIALGLCASKTSRNSTMSTSSCSASASIGTPRMPNSARQAASESAPVSPSIRCTYTSTSRAVSSARSTYRPVQ